MHFLTRWLDASGRGFSLFAWAHCLWLVGALAAVCFLAVLYRRATPSRRNTLLSVLCGSMILLEITKQLLLLATNRYSAEDLPMHLCSLCMFVCLGYARNRTADAGEFLYAVVLPCASGALLFPGWSLLPTGSFLSVHSFLYHILLLGFVVPPLCAGEIDPDIRRLPHVLFLLCLMALQAHTLNVLCGTNFFFLESPGQENPLALLARFPGKIPFVYLPLIAFLWLLMYGGAKLIRQNGKGADRQ